MNSKLKQNDTFDLTKGLMALLVIAIHTLVFKNGSMGQILIFPLLRIAVPIFFLFSGYFLFSKLIKTPKEEQIGVILKSEKRYLSLYLFWFIVLFPITLKFKDYLSHGFFSGFQAIVTDVLFGSTFLASWYIMALAIDIVIVYLLDRFFNKHLVLLIVLFLNLLAILMSNYGATSLGVEVQRLLPIGFHPYLSFPVGMLWIYIGKLFAERKINFLHAYISWTGFAVSLVGLYIEQMIIARENWSVASDCFIMLIPTCIFLFSIILNVNIKFQYRREARAFSTIGYCAHASIAACIEAIFNLLGFRIIDTGRSLIIWGLTVGASVLLTLVIIRVERFKYFHWIKVSH